MFRKTAFKLAGLYLAVLMLISFFFSIVVYELSVQELENGLRMPDSFLRQLSEGQLLPSTLEQLNQAREERYIEARERVLSRLIVTNLVILSGGGLLSYFLALRTLKPIEESHAALERFTADASHELRTPIAAMQSETEVALMNPKLTLAGAKQKLASNLEELAKLTDLTEGLLRLAQLDNSEIQRREVSLPEVVREAAERVQPLADKRRVRISGDAAKDVVCIYGERASLIEAVVIVLDNAIKYSPDNTEVTVSIAKSQRTASIKIQDNGIGMKPAELPYIFDRFYRADLARSKQTAHGYGIGLAIAKNIIEMHGGRIAVTSKVGRGSTFSLYLPTKGGTVADTS